MKYIDVKWKHNDESQPIRLISELDQQAYEVRKLEFFLDGRVGFAFEGGNSEGTELGDIEVPLVHEINRDNQFEAIEISREIFEEHWAKHGSL